MGAEVIWGIITALISIFFIALSIEFPGGTVDGVPGPGYFPRVIAVILLALSIMLIISGIKNKRVYFKLDDQMKSNLKSLLLTVAAMVAFLIIWNFIPFVVSAFLYLMALCFICRQKLKFAIVFSAVTSGVVYLIFEKIFHVMLNL